MCAARAAARSAALPPLLPEPRRVRARRGAWSVPTAGAIVVPPEGDGRDDATAERLRDGLAAACGRTLSIEGHGRPDGLGPAVVLAIDPGLGEDAAPPGREQAYRLEVGARGVRLTGAGPAGLRHGVETLLQLVDRRGRVPACRIDDAPALARRGIMLDVSRGKVPTEASLRALVALCATLRLNVLMLYTEHTFAFRRHPEIGRGSGALDAGTMRRLDRFAQSQGVELVPCLQSLGHMERVLSLPAYRALAETGMGWTIAPTDPRTYALLGDLYDEYLPNFASPLFNANCDEPWDLGRGRSAARHEALGPGGLYLEHLERIRALAARHGKRTLVWADVVHAHPARIDALPRDLMLLDWWYEADFDYDRVAVFGEHGLAFMVCPGTSSWNALFPRIDVSLANISGWAAAGRRHGAEGLLNTDWGDFGHYNLQGHSLFAYAWGAQEGWSGPVDPARFDRAFSRVVFGDARGTVAKLYRALGGIHDPGFTMFNGSALQYLFFDDVERGPFVDATRPGRLRACRSRLEALRPRIERAIRTTPREVGALHEMLWACDASLFAVRKAEAAREARAWRRGERRLDARGRRALARRLRGLADEQAALGRRLRALWLERARPSNLAFTLARVRRSIRMLRRTADRVAEGRPGRPPERVPLTHRVAIEAMRATAP